MTTEEIHNFNIDQKDIEIVKDFVHLGSVINANGDCNQEMNRRLRIRGTAMEEFGKFTKSKMC